jgi:hypothetical protein
MSILSTIETDASKVLTWITGEAAKVEKAGPGVLAGLGVLAAGVETALQDVVTSAGNPSQIVLNLGTDISDFKAVWPDIKAFLATLGIKV